MIKDKRMTDNEMFWFLTKYLLFFLIALATIFLFYDSPNLNQPMDYIVAIGTVALAIVAIITIQETKKTSEETKKMSEEYVEKIDNLVMEIMRDRYMEHIRLQMDELYMPILSHLQKNDVYFPDDERLFEIIKQKRYLGEPSFRDAIDSYVFVRDEYQRFREGLDQTRVFRNPDGSWSTEGEGKQQVYSRFMDIQMDMNSKGQKLRDMVYEDIETLQGRMGILLKEDKRS